MSFLSIFNIYVIPLVNPDGYEYAQTKVCFLVNWLDKMLSSLYRDECGVKIDHRMDIIILQILIVLELI